ncbi:Plant-specific TFIIB-related protein PTF2 [Cardamine amara subsp. amara]|uniref:Plant-specific TFIIB-related protein PTF2 n=1 Tax=Cardamine amara subsp. amara TaxID=228776 RepID=A0ABD1BA08_CARAN
MRCKRCNGSNFQRDESTGNSFCGGCGTLQEYNNYEAQLGGINGPQVVRKEGKGVLSMEEIAGEVGCELHQLGSMVKRVVEHLELELREFDLVGLFTKTASNSPRLSDVDRETKMVRIIKQGAFLMNCSLKWFLSTGRRPMPLVVAVLAFVVQVNGVKVKIEDLAKDAQVSLTTCKLRYKELSEKLVKAAHEVGLPWAKDVTVKNVVKHSGTLIGLMEAKSMRKRKEGTGDELVRSGGFCLDDIVRDCLSKESMYRYDDDNDDQDTVSRYFDVGGERQLSLFNNDDNISAKQLSTMYKELVDKVRSGTLAERSQGNNNSMWQRRSVSDMVSCADWWKGKSKLSQKLLLKEVLEKDVGLEALPPSYIKGCVAVERRREKIKAAKLRINAIQHPSDVVSEGALSLELEHSKKKRKRGSEIDWEDLVIQTLVLHNVNEEEIEKGHYKTLLDLHVFNSGEL